MPEIGEIRQAREIGKGGIGATKFIWVQCVDCKDEKWVTLHKERPARQRCKSCLGKVSRYGKQNGSWKGGKIKRICLKCERNFEIFPSTLQLGANRGCFCSSSCSAIYHRKLGAYNLTPNKPEQFLINFFNEKGLPFRYVGNGEVWLGNHNPDFINTNGQKQVIELFGTYWHPLFDVAQRIEHYKKYGFKTLIIWEDELKNPYKVQKRLKRFYKPMWTKEKVNGQ